MSTIERKEIAAAFRAAKSMLAKPPLMLGSNFICIALEYSQSLDSARSNAAVDAAIGVIRYRMCGSATLESWLRKHLGVCAADEFDMQAYRHRWLDALIEEFYS